MTQRKIIQWSVISFILFAMPLAVSQGISEVDVKIINAKPKALEFSGTSVGKSNSTVVWCLGTFSDDNSWMDLVKFRATISNGGQTKQSIVSGVNEVDTVVGLAYAGFVLDANAPEGTWTCELEAEDNAGDTASGKGELKVLPAHCANNVKDSGEQNTDCGGPCAPCTCNNGVKDEGELTVDCGGPCGYCTGKGSLTINAPSEVTANEGTVDITVSGFGKEEGAILVVEKPSGTISQKIEKDKAISLNADSEGTWKVKAHLHGYAPAEKEVTVKAAPMPIIMIAVPVVLILVIVAVLVLKKKGGGGKPPESPPASPPTDSSTQQWEGMGSQDATSAGLGSEPAPPTQDSSTLGQDYTGQTQEERPQI